jgi:hypothetical protein
MHNKKKNKTIDDLSIAQLLDDFVRAGPPENGRSPQKIDDEAYIRMMLKKDELRKLERTKRETRSQIHGSLSSSERGTIDENIRKRFFPDVIETPIEGNLSPVEKKKQPEEKEVTSDDGIVNEILNSIIVKDVSGLAAQMKEAVDFVQDAMRTSESERRLIEALEECAKPTEPCKKKSDSQMYNDNVLLLKRCQNCYFCAGENNRNDSIWCLCTNQDRSTEVETEDSWVKSKLNLSCWKALED